MQKLCLKVRGCALAGGVAFVISLLTVGCVHYEPKPLSPTQTAADFDKRALNDPGLLEFIAAAQKSDAVSLQPPAQWNFSTLTLVAFYFHPSLNVARAQWAVAQAGAKTAGGKPNPVLAVTPGYSANAPAGVSSWFPSVSVDVPIETAGKRGKRIAHAGHLSETARLNILTTAWQVRANLRGVLLEWSAGQRRVELLQRQLDLQDQLVKLLEQRLAAGTVAATEVSPARVARLKAGADLADARRQLAARRVALAEALGLSSKAVEGLQLDPAPPLPPESAEKFLSTEARDHALQGRPDVLAALSDYAAAESALQLEIAKQYPDVHLNPGYQFDQGEHKWTLGLSMELPLLNRNEGPIAEAGAKRVAAAARFLALQAKVIAEMDRAGQSHAAIHEQLKNSEAVLQAQRHQADSLQAAFQAGGADKFEAAAARLEAALAELAVLDAQTKIQQALGQLEDAVQIPFDALRMVEEDRGQRTEGRSQKSEIGGEAVPVPKETKP